MSKRTVMKTKTGKRVYVKRGKGGKFKDIQDIGRSSRQDQRKTHTQSDR